MRPISAVLAVALAFLGAARVGAQSPAEIHRLATLGQVWGFLKYHHPAVAGGTIDWDSALVATIPKVRAARTDAELDVIIRSLLDAVGNPRPCADCAPTLPDSTSINLDPRWLTDLRSLNRGTVRRLVEVRDNRHRGSGRYVAFTLTAQFAADTAFNTPQYPAEGQRLLALFRFWNAARYYFPYMSVNGGDWTAVLAEFIPRLIAAADATEYQLALLEATARLRDAHVTTVGAQITRALGWRMPSFEARSIDGQVVVWKLASGALPDSGGLQVGDVITHVDGEAIAQRRRTLVKYIAAGNSSVLERKLVQIMLRGRADTATYAVERDGRASTRRVAMAPQLTAAPPQTSYPVTELAKVLPSTDIGYIDMGRLNLAQVDSAFAIVKSTAGLVMDVRNYPRGTMYRFAELFNPVSRPFVKFTSVDSTHPGRVVWGYHFYAGRAGGNPDAYRGRIAILADERTQSHAEFTVMALRTAPENKVIGSQTAGADGNVTWLPLPGGMRTLFTGLGVFYPDGRKPSASGSCPTSRSARR